MENKNKFVVEAGEIDLEILEDYKAKGKLEPDFFPLMTYELVQSGYPTPDHGIMVARAWSGTNGEGQLLSGSGEFCKVEDVKKLIEQLRSENIGLKLQA